MPGLLPCVIEKNWPVAVAALSLAQKNNCVGCLGASTVYTRQVVKDCCLQQL